MLLRSVSGWHEHFLLLLFFLPYLPSLTLWGERVSHISTSFALHFKALFGELGADEGVRDEGYSPEFEAHPAVNNVITTIIRLIWAW